MIQAYDGQKPQIHPTAFIAPSADVIGRITLGENSSVFFQSVLRGDINDIQVGSETNIQDHCVLHVASDVPVRIGNRVSVGHGCVVHACTLEDEILVGMGSLIMDGVRVGSRSLIAAGSLLPKNRVYEPGSLIMGRPAKTIRKLTDEEKESIVKLAKKYIGVKDLYLRQSE